VLESDSPKSDRDEAAQMVRDIRRSIRPTAQQPLTDEQIEAIAAALGFNESGPHFAFARAIEAHIKGAL
jgi:regulator of sirC expression with transglutaminase-like and TPR domain